jgi:hemerythrin-like metal-binding protein
MTYIDWTDNLSVGINVIDEQHKVLFQIINDLHDSMKSGQSKMIIKEVLARLIDYTNFHFSLEETLMDQFGYMESPAHKKMHKDLLADIVAFQLKFERSQRAMGVQVLTFLKVWLNDHILKTDMKFGNYLRQNGMK